MNRRIQRFLQDGIRKGINNGFLKYPGQTGAKAEFSFNGAGIKWTAAKAPALGKAKIYLTLTIEVSGQKN